MTDSPDSENQGNSLIGAYQAAAAKQRLANRSITIAIIVTVLAFVFLIWSEFTDFRDNGIEEFSANLGAEATEFMPTVMESVNGMANRLVPVYIDSFSSVLERDEAAYHDVLYSQFTRLEDYAQNVAWPKLEEALAQLVIDQEMAMSDALNGIIEREQVAELSEAYRMAMDNYLTSFFEEHFLEETITGEEIIEKLVELAESDHSGTPTDSPYVLGMLIELLGLQMQEAAFAENTPFSTF